MTDLPRYPLGDPNRPDNAPLDPRTPGAAQYPLETDPAVLNRAPRLGYEPTPVPGPDVPPPNQALRPKRRVQG